MPKCKCCGQCCFYFVDKTTLKKCKYLSNNKCKIYNLKYRVGTVIDNVSGFELKCMLRIEDIFDYPGCNFNSGKPIFDRKLLKEANQMSKGSKDSSPQSGAIMKEAGTADPKDTKSPKDTQHTLNQNITNKMGKTGF